MQNVKPLDNHTASQVSVVIPAKNEADSLATLLPEIRRILPQSELIIVNDGSTDSTADVAQQYANQIITHAHSLGNGAAVKAGTRAARNPMLLLMDADGQHNPADIPELLQAFTGASHAMVVGARNSNTHAGVMRRLANGIYNLLATYTTGQKIKDLTSGFRVVDASIFKQFIYMLPNGFSYPATITMALARKGVTIQYIPINARKRTGKSHIKPLKDGVRFLLIILKISVLYSPMKLFAPTAFSCFATGGVYYLYTYLTFGRFTNMSVLLFITALITFLIGLVSEQITTLLYASSEDD